LVGILLETVAEVADLRLGGAEAVFGDVGVAAEDSDVGVIVTAVGSSRQGANARTSTVASAVAVGTRWIGTTSAFATGPKQALQLVQDLYRGRRNPRAEAVVEVQAKSE